MIRNGIGLLISLLVFNVLFQSSGFTKPKAIDFDISGCYTGAMVSWKTVDDGHPWNTTLDDIRAFQKLTGKKLAFIYWSMAFSYDHVLYPFPVKAYNTARENGSILFLTWEPRDWNISDPFYFNKSLLPKIIAGDFDEYIDSWIAEIKKLDVPILLRFAPEMNTESFSWTGVMNGGKDGGAKTYISAYRHVRDRFRKAGVKNVLWVWTPINWGVPFEPWNHYTNYYPGSEYVDIIAMDEYNWGASQPWSKWNSFNEIYWQFYSQITKLYPDKTLMIGEFSCSDKGGDKATWIKEVFRDIKEKYPKIKAFIWFHIDNSSETVNNLMENTDWRIDSSPRSANAAKDALSDPYYLQRVKFKDTNK